MAHAATSTRPRPLPDRQLNEARKRRLLLQLDRALGRQSKPATATPAQREREARRTAGYRDAQRSYGELKRAILDLGGIRANPDYPRREIPADVYRPRGLAPDEMAQFLGPAGHHFEGDTELFSELHRRRDRLKDTLSDRGRVRNPQLICMDIERDELGRFKRHRH